VTNVRAIPRDPHDVWMEAQMWANRLLRDLSAPKECTLAQAV
jgi:hypothetical protein